MEAPDLSKLVEARAAADFDMFRRVVLPEEIDHHAYVDILHILSYASKFMPHERVQIFCNGGGGDADSTNAIVDLIQQHEKCDGYLFGTALSAHGLVWAACSRRFVSRRGALGIHQAAAAVIVKEEGEKTTATEKRLIEAARIRSDNLMFALFAAASDKDESWWRKRTPGSGMCELISAEELIAIEMANALFPRVDWYGQPVLNACEGCGKPCGADDWLDVIVPDDVWLKISGHMDSGGILCAGCITERAALLNDYCVGRLIFE